MFSCPIFGVDLNHPEVLSTRPDLVRSHPAKSRHFISVIGIGRGTANAGNIQGTLSHHHISPSIPVYENDRLRIETYSKSYITRYTSIRRQDHRIASFRVTLIAGLKRDFFQSRKWIIHRPFGKQHGKDARELPRIR